MGNEVEEIKQRLDLADVIGASVPLMKAGGANMKARCPFHAEKTPSFYVSRDRQMWHCFGCGEGGDVFTFVMKMEGVDFREALKLLADKAGVKLPEWKPEEASERARLLEALALATRFYAAILREAPQGAAARDYLRGRGVSEGMVAAFGIGYAPESWDALQAALGKRRVAAADLERAGMLVRRERGSGWYDRFRDRVMFPIRDVHGQTVGFTGRVLSPDAKEAKYVNTPQTPLYNKSAALYGIDLARQAIREQDLAIVVEGNLDVVACHQIGMANTVAASGTALTAEQLRFLGRFTKNVAIAFDADAAGETAARRGIDLAVGAGFTVRVIRIPEGAGKDPDECIRKDPAVWRKAVAEAAHFMDWLIGSVTRGRDLGDPAVKKQTGGALLDAIATFPDAIEQAHWLQRVASLLALPEAVLREQMGKGGGRREEGGHRTAMGDHVESSVSKLPPPSRHRLLSESFLALLYARPEHAAAAVAGMPAESLADEDIQALYRDAVATYTRTGQFPDAGIAGADPGSAGFPQARTPANGSLLRSIILRGERDYASLPPQKAEEEFRTVGDAIRDLAWTRRLEALTRAMREAEARDDREAVAELEKRVHELMTSR